MKNLVTVVMEKNVSAVLGGEPVGICHRKSIE